MRITIAFCSHASGQRSRSYGNRPNGENAARVRDPRARASLRGRLLLRAATDNVPPQREWRLLRTSPTWPRFKPALRESAIGKPVRFLFRGATSGIQIHHTYHLAQFEQETGTRVDQDRLIFEFGGGYGSMCRQAHLLGFK